MDLVRRRPTGRLYWSDIHKVSPYSFQKELQNIKLNSLLI